MYPIMLVSENNKNMKKEEKMQSFLHRSLSYLSHNHLSLTIAIASLNQLILVDVNSNIHDYSDPI